MNGNEQIAADAVALLKNGADTLGQELAEAMKGMSSEEECRGHFAKWIAIIDEKAERWPAEVKSAFVDRCRIAFRKALGVDDPDIRFEDHVADSVLSNLKDTFKKESFTWERSAAKTSEGSRSRLRTSLEQRKR